MLFKNNRLTFKQKADPNEAWLERIAYHEAGHALVLIKLGRGHAIINASINPESGRFHYTSPFSTLKSLQDELVIDYAGQAAEEVRYGTENYSSGCAEDIEKVENIAKFIITKCQNPRLTEQDVCAAIEDLEDLSLEKSKNILIQNKDQLDVLAEALMQRITLTGAEMHEVLGLEVPEYFNLEAFPHLSVA